jgi:hypothetical protein
MAEVLGSNRNESKIKDTSELIVGLFWSKLVVDMPSLKQAMRISLRAHLLYGVQSKKEFRSEFKLLTETKDP